MSQLQNEGWEFLIISDTTFTDFILLLIEFFNRILQSCKRNDILHPLLCLPPLKLFPSLRVFGVFFIIATGSQHSTNELSMACDRLTNIGCVASQWTWLVEKAAIQQKKEPLMRAFAVLIGPHIHHMRQPGLFCLLVKRWVSQEQTRITSAEIRRKICTYLFIRC